MRHHIQLILLEDWFVKSPPASKIKQINSWHARYFALAQVVRCDEKMKCKKGKNKANKANALYHLMYWNHENDRRNGKSPIRIIPLLPENDIHIVPHPSLPDKYPFTLKLSTYDRVFYLCAYSEAQKDLWYETLKPTTEVEVTNVIKAQNEEEEEVEEKEKKELFKEDPIYAAVFDIGERTSTTSSSSSDTFSLDRSRLASETSCESWKDCTFAGLSNRDSGISTSLSWSSHDHAPPNHSKHCCGACRTEEQQFNQNDDKYVKMMSYTGCEAENKPENSSCSQFRTSPPRRGRGSSLPAGLEFPACTNLLNNASADSNCEYEKMESPLNSPSRTIAANYDVPKTTNNLVKKIKFYDITLEIPHLSTVQITADELKVKTDSYEWILTHKAAKEEMFVTHV